MKRLLRVTLRLTTWAIALGAITIYMSTLGGGG